MMRHDAYEMGEAVPSHALAPCVEEEVVMAGDRPDREPVAQCRAGLLPQWQHALAAPLVGGCVDAQLFGEQAM